MAKRLISDAAAKCLIEKLNRRMGALAILTRDPRGIAWPAWLFQVLLSVVAVFSVTPPNEGWRPWLLLITVCALWGLMEVYNTGLNKRIDALVELLQQEGMLHTELPPDSVPEE